MNAETIAETLGLRRVGRGWRGACPIHGGSSFTVNEKDGTTLFYCWSGCDRAAILAELKTRGLWPSEKLTVKSPEASPRKTSRADVTAARWWALSAIALAESALEEMSWCDPERRRLTLFLIAAKNPALRIDTYRQMKRANPTLADALVKVGRDTERFRQIAAARFLMEGARAS